MHLNTAQSSQPQAPGLGTPPGPMGPAPSPAQARDHSTPPPAFVPDPGDVHRAKRLYAQLEAIPAEQWTTQTLENTPGARCVLGHLGVRQIPAVAGTLGPRYEMTPDALWLDAQVRATPALGIAEACSPATAGNGEAVYRLNDGTAGMFYTKFGLLSDRKEERAQAKARVLYGLRAILARLTGQPTPTLEA